MKLKHFLLGASLLASVTLAKPAFAVVDYVETITCGTSTTLATGSSTVLARALYSDSGKKFRATVVYENPLAVDMHYTVGTTITPSATVGSRVVSGSLLQLGLDDMKSLKFCAGTTTVASYGTVTAFYETINYLPDRLSQRDSFIEFFPLPYND